MRIKINYFFFCVLIVSFVLCVGFCFGKRMVICEGNNESERLRYLLGEIFELGCRHNRISVLKRFSSLDEEGRASFLKAEEEAYSHIKQRFDGECFSRAVDRVSCNKSATEVCSSTQPVDGEFFGIFWVVFELDRQVNRVNCLQEAYASKESERTIFLHAETAVYDALFQRAEYEFTELFGEKMREGIDPMK